MIKIIYIAGDGRSGSTWLSRVLSGIDNSILVGECHRFWVRYYEAETFCSCGEHIATCNLWDEVDNKLRQEFPNYDPLDFNNKVKELQYFKNFEKIPSLIDSPVWQDFSTIVTRYYQIISEISKKKVIIDNSKSMSWVYFLIQLQIFDIRVLHLERELPNVSNSWKKELLLPEYRNKKVAMPKKGILLSTKSWLKIKRQAIPLKKYNQYLFISYEEICANFEHQIKIIETFIEEGIPIQEVPEMLDHSIGGNPNVKQLTYPIVPNPNRKETPHLSFLERVILKGVHRIVKAFLS